MAKMIVSVLQNYKELECKVEKIHIIAIITVIPGKRFSDHSNHMETTLMTSAIVVIVVVTVMERVIREGASVIHHC